jgi:hypothetical protein
VVWVWLGKRARGVKFLVSELYEVTPPTKARQESRFMISARAAAVAALVACGIGALSFQRCGWREYETDESDRIVFTQLESPQYPCALVFFHAFMRFFNLTEWLFPLEAEYLIEKATRAAGGLDVFGAAYDPWLTHLNHLLEALNNEADLSPIGRFISQEQLIKSLEQRARVEELRRQHPSILEEPIRPPIIITGLPRTGTTLLHNLLTLTHHPEVQWLSYAETLQPAAAPGSQEHESAIVEVGQAVEFMSLLRPLFSSMHEMKAELPHEELHLQALSFSAMLFESQYHIPSFGERYENQTDHKPSYWYIRELLQLRQWLGGGVGGGGAALTKADGERRVWALKSPMHMESSEALLHAFPEGFTLVRLHRDPVQVILSLCTMLVYIQALQSDFPKPRDVFEYWTARLERVLRKAVADDALLRSRSRGDGEEGRVNVIDVTYEELMAGPEAVAQRIFEAAGLTVGGEVRLNLAEYMRKHPRNATGAGRFRYRFGVFTGDESAADEAAVRDRLAARFEFYTSRFLKP